MSLRTIQKIYLILFVLLSTNVFAYGVPPIPSSGSAVTDNKIYGGLKWDFNGGIKPEAVIGFRSARVNPSSYTNGGDISISAKFIDSFELGKARLKYFSGINTVQNSNYGIVFSFWDKLFGTYSVMDANKTNPIKFGIEDAMTPKSFSARELLINPFI